MLMSRKTGRASRQECICSGAIQIDRTTQSDNSAVRKAFARISAHKPIFIRDDQFYRTCVGSTEHRFLTAGFDSFPACAVPGTLALGRQLFGRMFVDSTELGWNTLRNTTLSFSCCPSGH